MKFKDLESLKYYLAFALVVMGFYLYSGMVGWKWLGAASTDKTKPDRTNPAYQRRYLHK